MFFTILLQSDVILKYKPFHLLVTGGAGYIGTTVIRFALNKGWRVSVLGRAPISASELVQALPWRLGEEIPQGLDIPVDAVIHLAHQWESVEKEEYDINFRGSELLAEWARENKVNRLVYASSISARLGSLNRYGRIKARTETLFNSSSDIVARIGLVYGGPQVALWGTLCHITSKLWILPMVNPKKGVQPIHIDDLAEGLLRLAKITENNFRVIGLGQDQPISFGVFLRMIAKIVHKRSILILPVSLILVLKLITLIRTMPFLPKINPERVLGLAGLTQIPTAAGLKAIDLNLRPLKNGLELLASDRRKLLLKEGRFLIAYCSCNHLITSRSLISYVRAIEASSKPWPLSFAISRLPTQVLMRFIEPIALLSGEEGQDLLLRIHIASMLVDSSPRSYDLYYPYNNVNLWYIYFRFVKVSLFEVLAFPFRLLATVLLWR